MSANRKIQTKTDIEWLLHRPHNIIGAVQEMKHSGFVLENDKFIYKDYTLVPGFFKIINEIIDNTLDVYIKSNGKSGTKIDITVTDTKIKVKDNGYGIPVEKIESHISGKTWAPVVAWGEPRAGSNFDDEHNQGQLGTNGVGSFATVVFSKKFHGTTCDGKLKFDVTFSNNLSKTEYKDPVPCKLRGTTVEFEPDLKRFGLTKITDIYKNMLKKRLYDISFSYPKIQLTFNKEKITTDTKTYISKFSSDAVTFEGDNYTVAIMPNNDDDFHFYAYTNGLANIKHGTQIDYFLEKLTPLLRDKLLRKYKGIKPGDIKNKITMVVFFRDFIRAKFDGQSKEQFTSPYGKITEHLGKVDFNKWVEKIYQNKAIIDPIIEIYKIKEEFEKRKALKGLEKKVQRIDSEKYYSATKHKKYLMICEGESASGGLMPGLGSEDFGYYELKGKPLNAYDQPQQKFASNKELSELYHIIKTEGYDYIIFATDQDLDGYTIRGLLLGFFDRYLNTMLKEGKVGVLQTPIRAMIKNNKLNAWIYNLKDNMNETSGYSKYFKGIGSWKPEWLEQVIAKDGFKKMIQIWEYDDDAKESMDSWLNSKRPDDRKEMLRNNEFDLIKL